MGGRGEVTRSGGVKRIAALVEPAITGKGYTLVRVEIVGQQRPRVQVMIERSDSAPMGIDDCADVSRALSAVLDVEDLFMGAYTLEVSSPGIDRPLVRLADYDRFSGLEAKLELCRPIGGRRRFRGRLAGTRGEGVRLRLDENEIEVPFADIQRAKLVLNDELIALAADRTEEANP